MTKERSNEIYLDEYAQVVIFFSTLTQINDEKWVQSLLTSLVHPEMIYPGKLYEAYCSRVPKSGPLCHIVTDLDPKVNPKECHKA